MGAFFLRPFCPNMENLSISHSLTKPLWSDVSGEFIVNFVLGLNTSFKYFSLAAYFSGKMLAISERVKDNSSPLYMLQSTSMMLLRINNVK
jgi:hypothetical protein